jgi:GNAT superfamily N-acetyltransferase
VHTTPDRDAVALWLPAGPGAPGQPDGYSVRLAAITGPLIGRFEAFDTALGARHPAAVPHQHLAILAVRPGRQGQNVGTTLLAARHVTLDVEDTPSFLQASSPDSRRLYLRHGYIDYGPRIELPVGPALHPMWRQPRDPQDAGRQR